MSRETQHLRREILRSGDPLRNHSINNRTLHEGLGSIHELKPSKCVERSLRRKARAEEDRLMYEVHQQAKIDRIRARVGVSGAYDGYDPDVFRAELRFLRRVGVQIPRSD